MADPKLTPALNRAPVKAQKIADTPAATKIETPAAQPKLSEKQKARMGGADYMTGTQPQLPPPAAKLTPPSTEALGLDEVGRLMLASTSQVNSVSTGLKNENDICGGAAMVSALILRSTTPEAARANAGALRAAFNASPAKAMTSVEVQVHVSAALKNFEAGKMSEEDVCYLQQAAYVVGKGVPGESEKGGLSTGAMASMVADLVGSGATIGAETSFSQAFDGVGGHWVAKSGDVAFNTAQDNTPAAKVDFNKLPVTDNEFSGRVRVLNNKDGTRTVQLQSRYLSPPPATGKKPGAPDGSGWKAEITPLNPGDKTMTGLVGSNAKRLRDALQPTTLFHR